MTGRREKSDVVKSFELFKTFYRVQPRPTHTWGDVVRRESSAVEHGQRTVIGRVLHVGITAYSVGLAAYHWLDVIWTWSAVIRQ